MAERIISDKYTDWVSHSIQPDRESHGNEKYCPHFEIIEIAAMLVNEYPDEIGSKEKFCGVYETSSLSSFRSEDNYVEIYTTCENVYRKLMSQLAFVANNTEVPLTSEEIVSNTPQYGGIEVIAKYYNHHQEIRKAAKRRGEILDVWRHVMFDVASVHIEDTPNKTGRIKHMTVRKTPEELSEEEIISWVKNIHHSLKTVASNNCTQHPAKFYSNVRGWHPVWWYEEVDDWK